MKRHLLRQVLSVCSLLLFLTGCTTLNYVNDDFDTVKSSNIQTSENFNLIAVEKTTSGNITVKAGVSETVLEGALVLYLSIKNNTDSTFKFDTSDVIVTSPIGEVTFISPSSYIEAYQNYETSNYAGMMNAGAALGGFANIKNQYRQTVSNPDNNRTIEERGGNSDLAAIERTISGIQKHSLTTYKFIKPGYEEYYYIFLRKPEEYPVVVKYKELTYKFGGKKNGSN